MERRKKTSLQSLQSMDFLQPEHGLQPRQRVKGPDELKLCSTLIPQPRAILIGLVCFVQTQYITCNI